MSTQADCAQHRSPWKHAALVTAVVGIVFTIPSVMLVASAFNSESEMEAAAVSRHESESENKASDGPKMAHAFIMGWICCLAAKLCKMYGREVVASGSASLCLLVEQVQSQVSARRESFNKQTFIILAAGSGCVLPIFVLMVSAFTAVPDSEPSENGLASESSRAARAFTLGWIFCLVVKLCREFSGQVGFSSAAALVSC